MSQAEPIIFLDFDGVLNHTAWLLSLEDAMDVNSEVCPENLKHLTYLLENSGAKVVISSSWRQCNALEGMVAALVRAGLPESLADRFIDVTPSLWGDDIRGHEIAQWIEDSGQEWAVCILDDSSDMAHMAPYLVQTNMKKGLTKRHANQALKMLNSQAV